MAKSRTPISIRLSYEIYHSWRRYCEISRGWGYKGEMTEVALMEYMVNHPVEDCRIEVQVEMGNNLHDIQRDLSNQILCRNIESCLKLLSDEVCNQRGNPLIIKEELLGYVKEAVKVKSPSEKLINLLQRVKDGKHFE